jgi:hypothetical protein
MDMVAYRVDGLLIARFSRTAVVGAGLGVVDEAVQKSDSSESHESQAKRCSCLHDGHWVLLFEANTVRSERKRLLSRTCPLCMRQDLMQADSHVPSSPPKATGHTCMPSCTQHQARPVLSPPVSINPVAKPNEAVLAVAGASCASAPTRRDIIYERTDRVREPVNSSTLSGHTGSFWSCEPDSPEDMRYYPLAV